MKRDRRFAMVRPADHASLECELRYHGEVGVKAQLYLNNAPRLARDQVLAM